MRRNIGILCVLVLTVLSGVLLWWIPHRRAQHLADPHQGRLAAKLAISGTPLPSREKEPVVINVRVSAPRAGLPLPRGSVVILVDGADVAEVNIDDHGQAVYVDNNLRAGAHTITARYLGDSRYY